MIHIAVCDDEKDFVAYLTDLLDRYAAGHVRRMDEKMGII